MSVIVNKAVIAKSKSVVKKSSSVKKIIKNNKSLSIKRNNYFGDYYFGKMTFTMCGFCQT